MAEKIGWFAKTRIFLGEVRTEMSKVVWPTQEQTKNYMLLVLGVTAVLATVIGLWDLVLGRVMSVVLGV